ncbi:MAG: YggT family protein [Alcaligenaceae bacterium]|nr:YggT family protein [Alcaligenaceae bacterium]
MFSHILLFLFNVVFSALGILLIARAWIFAIRLHPFNPYSQAILRATDWLVHPIRKVLPPGNRIEWSSLVAGWLVALVYLLLTWAVLVQQLPPVAMLPPALIAAVLTLAKWAFNVVLWATLIQALLSWVNPMAPVMPFLQTFTAPLLNPIRRILPNLGGFDLSPLVLLILAQIAIMLLQSLSFSLFGV